MRSLLSKWSMQFAFCVASVLLISTQVQAATFYFHNDHLGTPQVLTDFLPSIRGLGRTLTLSVFQTYRLI